ncbi:tRNA (adenosine(37)-N6)-dimethylallyltransferase MiaA [bacterium 3DAC]|nr:tRNA (adenosine(37)-N6)-dimethylallyltransferase MiaA [Dictyoglomota bacterium]UZN23154.1 tRNA (adenosine(37)-N6)-dimethylallyltransferase MiaA [bacterium 3DAC]
MEEKYKEKQRKLAISIVGLTASGKTSFLHNILDLLIAEGVSFTTISVDSGAVYKHLDIGTAKPSAEEIERYNYRLVDVVSPCERYSLARFIKDTDEVLRHVDTDVVFLIGGTPLYFYTLVGESGYVPVQPDSAIRNHLRQLVSERGSEYIYNLMKALDPISAEKIHPNDVKRIIRTIEINLSTGKMRTYATEYYTSFQRHFTELRYILLPPPDVLRGRIYKRTHIMFQMGFVEEAGRVADMCPPPAPWLEVLGYKHAYDAYRGHITEDEAINEVFTDTWRFSRRQRTWFKNDKKAHFIITQEDQEHARDEIIGYIRNYTRNR